MKHLRLTNQQFDFLRVVLKDYEYEEDESEIYYFLLENFRNTAVFQNQFGGNDND